MSPSAVTLGRYQLQDQIAAGGMGEVWRGDRHHSNGGLYWGGR